MCDRAVSPGADDLAHMFDACNSAHAEQGNQSMDPESSFGKQLILAFGLCSFVKSFANSGLMLCYSGGKHQHLASIILLSGLLEEDFLFMLLDRLYECSHAAASLA